MRVAGNTCFENIFSIARGRDLIHECKHDTNSFRGRQIHFAGDKKRQIHFAGDKKRQIHFAGDKFISRETNNSFRVRQIHLAGDKKRLLCILSPFKFSVVNPTAILSFIRETKIPFSNGFMNIMCCVNDTPTSV